MSYSSAVLALSPQVFFKFDETSGTTATDASGNGRTGTHFGAVALAQPSLLGDGSGTSVYYNGSCYTGIATPGNLNSGNITVNMRIRATAANGAGTGTQVLAGRWSGSSGYLWLLTLENGIPRFTMRTGAGGTTNYIANAPSALTLGDHTIGCTFDSSTARLFVDGAVAGSVAAAGSIASTITEFEIARAAAAVYGNVQVDGFAYWITALSTSNMANLHTEATSAPPGGALAATLPVPTLAASGSVQNSGTLSARLPVPAVAINGTASDPRRAGFGLALDSMTPTSVIPPTSGGAPVPLHIITPTVPAPVLVDGRPA